MKLAPVLALAAVLPLAGCTTYHLQGPGLPLETQYTDLAERSDDREYVENAMREDGTGSSASAFGRSADRVCRKPVATGIHEVRVQGGWLRHLGAVLSFGLWHPQIEYRCLAWDSGDPR